MMKILHTSDWHLGQTLYDYDRTEEHRHFLKQLIHLVTEHRPDALVICGDVFDRINPTNEARNMYLDTLLAIHDQNPTTSIIVTAGNHDNKSSLNMEGRLWDRLRVTVIGQVERHENGSLNLDRHIIEIKDGEGLAKGFVVAVPHIFEQNYPQLEENATKEERIQQFFKLLLEKVGQRNPLRLPIVLTAHLAMTGGNFAGHDFQDMIGQIATIDQRWLGTGYDYLALGHIHGPQNVKGSCPLARYCGSPIPVSFDEPGLHGVSMVTVTQGQVPEVEQLPIENIRPLLTIPPQPVPFAEAVEEMRQLDSETEAYIRLNVLDNAPLPPNYREVVDLSLENKKSRFCVLKRTAAKNTKSAITEEETALFDPDNLPSPVALAQLFYQEKFGNDMPADLMDKLEEATKKTMEATR